jgi:hypothetical protein
VRYRISAMSQRLAKHRLQIKADFSCDAKPLKCIGLRVRIVHDRTSQLKQQQERKVQRQNHLKPISAICSGDKSFGTGAGLFGGCGIASSLRIITSHDLG